MDIVKKDLRKGTVQLKITDLDDLWYLSHIIEPGDLVKGKTTRKIRIGDTENAKTTKKIFNLTIEAEQVNYDTETIRINGKIKDGPEDLPRDTYQAICLEENSIFDLKKEKWPLYLQKKLQEATEKKYSYLLCLLDREEVIFALTKKFGYDVLTELKGDVPKKSKKVEVKKDFQQEIIKNLETYNARHSPEKIILASPVFYKDDLFKTITSKELKKKIVLTSCSSVNKTALDEVMRRPELAQTLKNSRAREEQLLVDELLAEINKNNLAVYGWLEVKQAIDQGAVKKLLVTDKFILKKKKQEKFQELDEKMKQVDVLKGEVQIIFSKHESGEKINGLGGIAALLRYKTK